MARTDRGKKPAGKPGFPKKTGDAAPLPLQGAVDSKKLPGIISPSRISHRIAGEPAPTLDPTKVPRALAMSLPDPPTRKVPKKVISKSKKKGHTLESNPTVGAKPGADETVPGEG